MIELDRVTVRHGGVTAVAELTLSVPRGELLVLVGASGSGKSTTLKLINGLVSPSDGVVRVGGVALGAEAPHLLRRRVGYVFQRLGLFPHMRVWENVGVTPSLLGWSPSRIRARVDALLALVELDADAVRERFPHELSGGQAQRVAVARALAAEPPVLLLDEPFGALDPLTREALQGQLARIHRSLELTTVFVTHDITEAVLLGDRIGVMREGRLVQVGAAHALRATPADDYVRALLATPARQAEALAARLREGEP